MRHPYRPQNFEHLFRLDLIDRHVADLRINEHLKGAAPLMFVLGVAPEVFAFADVFLCDNSKCRQSIGTRDRPGTRGFEMVDWVDALIAKIPEISSL